MRKIAIGTCLAASAILPLALTGQVRLIEGAGEDTQWINANFMKLERDLSVCRSMIADLQKRVEALEARLAALEPKPPESETQGQSGKSPLRFDLIRLMPYPSDMVGVQVKITNLSKRRISAAEVTCIVLDASGKEIGFARHYVIGPADAGLAPSAATYFEYIVDVQNPSKANSVRFHVEDVRF